MVGPDPKMKQNIRTELHAHVYQRAQQVMVKQLDEIIQHNMHLQGHSDPYLSFQGEIYSMSGTCGRRPRLTPRTHRAVLPLLEAYLKEVQELQLEEGLALTCLTNLLNVSNCVQDYYRLLPESLHQPLRAYDHCGTQLSTLDKLSPSDIEEIINLMAPGINRLRQRMVRNLLM